jgi:adenine deaminase
LNRRIDTALGREPADLVIKDTGFLDVATGEIARGDVAITDDRIVGTFESYRGRREIDGRDHVVVPGFIDTHVHVESTHVTPGEFDRAVLPRGTTTAICDPHEIANVLGVQGLRFFLDSAPALAMDLRVQLSSCVPATQLETSGARLGAADLVALRDHPAVIGLAEMMNFPGLLHHDPEVIDKLLAFEGWHVDGHCPLVRGYDLNAYAACGIKNCHESTSLAEAREKMRKGMQVLLRDGSVSKDIAELTPLLTDATWPFLAFCTDDRNPLDIADEGHIDHLVRKAIQGGAPVAAAYRAATWAAANAFGLRDRGMVAPGYRADLLLMSDLESVSVEAVIRNGRLVDAGTFEGRPLPEVVGRRSIQLDAVGPEAFQMPGAAGDRSVVGVIPGSIVTEHLRERVPVRNGLLHADPARDLLKVCVFSRHGKNRNVGRGFVKGLGLSRGALASSVGHDSHNVIVVGSDDDEMALAVNRIIDLEGGFVAVQGTRVLAELPLPIAGLMTELSFETVGDRLLALRRAVAELGCPLKEAFLQLAFLPLPVIPHLKITDLGLVDVDRFEVIAG